MRRFKRFIFDYDILLESKQEETIKRYFNIHKEHDLVKSNPEQAKTLIGHALKLAQGHDEAKFLTLEYLKGTYKPDEDEDSVKSLLKTWRTGKTRGLIPKDTNISSMDNDAVVKFMHDIPELRQIGKLKGASGRSAGALTGLQPHYIGDINLPEHGKLQVYRWRKKTLGEEPVEQARQNLKKICVPGTSWCVLNDTSGSQHMLHYSHGPGFFTYVNENGNSVFSHGFGDRGVVDIENQTANVPQEEIIKQTANILPKEEQEPYLFFNNKSKDNKFSKEQQLRMFSEYGDKHSVAHFLDPNMDTHPAVLRLIQQKINNGEYGNRGYDIQHSLSAHPNIKKNDTDPETALKRIKDNESLALHTMNNSELDRLHQGETDEPDLRSKYNKLLNHLQVAAWNINPNVALHAVNHRFANTEVMQAALHHSDPSVVLAALQKTANAEYEWRQENKELITNANLNSGRDLMPAIRNHTDPAVHKAILDHPILYNPENKFSYEDKGFILSQLAKKNNLHDETMKRIIAHPAVTGSSYIGNGTDDSIRSDRIEGILQGISRHDNKNHIVDFIKNNPDMRRYAIRQIIRDTVHHGDVIPALFTHNNSIKGFVNNTNNSEEVIDTITDLVGHHGNHPKAVEKILDVLSSEGMKKDRREFSDMRNILVARYLNKANADTIKGLMATDIYKDEDLQKTINYNIRHYHYDKPGIIGHLLEHGKNLSAEDWEKASQNSYHDVGIADAVLKNLHKFSAPAPVDAETIEYNGWSPRETKQYNEHNAQEFRKAHINIIRGLLAQSNLNFRTKLLKKLPDLNLQELPTDSFERLALPQDNIKSGTQQETEYANLVFDTYSKLKDKGLSEGTDDTGRLFYRNLSSTANIPLLRKITNYKNITGQGLNEVAKTLSIRNRDDDLPIDDKTREEHDKLFHEIWNHPITQSSLHGVRVLPEIPEFKTHNLQLEYPHGIHIATSIINGTNNVQLSKNIIDSVAGAHRYAQINYPTPNQVRDLRSGPLDAEGRKNLDKQDIQSVARMHVSRGFRDLLTSAITNNNPEIQEHALKYFDRFSTTEGYGGNYEGDKTEAFDLFQTQFNRTHTTPNSDMTSRILNHPHFMKMKPEHRAQILHMASSAVNSEEGVDTILSHQDFPSVGHSILQELAIKQIPNTSRKVWDKTKTVDLHPDVKQAIAQKIIVTHGATPIDLSDTGLLPEIIKDKGMSAETIRSSLYQNRIWDRLSWHRGKMKDYESHAKPLIHAILDKDISDGVPDVSGENELTKSNFRAAAQLVREVSERLDGLNDKDYEEILPKLLFHRTISSTYDPVGKHFWLSKASPEERRQKIISDIAHVQNFGMTPNRSNAVIKTLLQNPKASESDVNHAIHFATIMKTINPEHFAMALQHPNIGPWGLKQIANIKPANSEGVVNTQLSELAKQHPRYDPTISQDDHILPYKPEEMLLNEQRRILIETFRWFKRVRNLHK